MNFIEYCVATKNFSALDAISDYTKSFGFIDSFKRAIASKDSSGNKKSFMDKVKAAAKVTSNKLKDVTGITKLNRAKITLNKRAGMSNSDILKNLLKQNGRANMKGALSLTRDVAGMRNKLRNDERDYNMLYRQLSEDSKNKMKAGEKSGIKALNDIVSGRTYEDFDNLDKFVDKYKHRDYYKNDKKVNEKDLHNAIHGTDND